MSVLAPTLANRHLCLQSSSRSARYGRRSVALIGNLELVGSVPLRGWGGLKRLIDFAMRPRVTDAHFSAKFRKLFLAAFRAALTRGRGVSKVSRVGRYDRIRLIRGFFISSQNFGHAAGCSKNSGFMRLFAVPRPFYFPGRVDGTLSGTQTWTGPHGGDSVVRGCTLAFVRDAATSWD
jgi:hypothetical protein